LPIIEAQNFRCPVACSNRAAMPEVAGSGALFFDPDSVESMVQTLCRILSQDGPAGRLRDAGKQNLKRFGWDKAARTFLETVEAIAGR
jgi:glycosyltransferase involved in cell wall biosynthesis